MDAMTESEKDKGGGFFGILIGSVKNIGSVPIADLDKIAKEEGVGFEIGG